MISEKMALSFEPAVMAQAPVITWFFRLQPTAPHSLIGVVFLVWSRFLHRDRLDYNAYGYSEILDGLLRHLGFEVRATLPNVALLDGQERGLTILGKRVD